MFTRVVGYDVEVLIYLRVPARHPDTPLHPLELAACSGSAMGISIFCTYPHEVVRVNLQVQVRGVDTKYSGIVNTFLTIFREEGWRGLYKGMAANMLRFAIQ